MRVRDPPDTGVHPKRLEHRYQGFIYVGDKQLKKLQKIAWDAGWWPSKKKNGIMWFAPDETGHVMLHSSSSDRYAFAQARRDFIAAGLDA